MKRSLYNEELKINDLMRQAHPGGGLDVINAPSPSGGDPVVEDNIEKQLKILRMVYKKPIGRVVSKLEKDLHKAGASHLANKVASVLKFAQEWSEQQISDAKKDLENIKRIIFDIQRARGEDRYPGERLFPRLRGYFTGYDPVSKRKVPKVLSEKDFKDFLSKVVTQDLPNSVKKPAAEYMGQFFGGDQQVRSVIESLAINDPARENFNVGIKVLQSGVSAQDIEEAFTEKIPKIKEMVRNFDKVVNSPSSPKTLKEMYGANNIFIDSGYEDYLQNAEPILEKIVFTDRTGLKRFQKESEEYLKNLDEIASNYPAYASAANGIASTIRNIISLRDISDNKQLLQLVRNIDTASPAPSSSDDSGDKGEVKDVQTGIDNSGDYTARTPVSGKDKATGDLLYAISELQKHLKVDVTGQYDDATHRALGKYLNENMNAEGELGQRARAAAEFYMSMSPGKTGQNIQAIAEYLLGRAQTERPSDVSAPKLLTVIDIDGIKFPVANWLQASKRNPWHFLRGLQRYGLVPNENEMSDEQVVKSEQMKSMIAKIGAIIEKFKGEIVSSNIISLMYDIMNNLEEAIKDKSSAVKTLDWLDRAFPKEMSKIRSNALAVSDLEGYMVNYRYGDDNGNINVSKAEANRLNIWGILRYVINQYNLQGVQRQIEPKQPPLSKTQIQQPEDEPGWRTVKLPVSPSGETVVPGQFGQTLQEGRSK